jgi:hypothetical protein
MENICKDKKMTLMGIITAVEWDEDDNVVAIAISTPEEKEYRIEDNPLGAELLELIYESVKVTGTVIENEFGNKSIWVDSYTLVDDEQYDDEFE